MRDSSSNTISLRILATIFLVGLLLGYGVAVFYYEVLADEDESSGSSQANLPPTPILMATPTIPPTPLPTLVTAADYYERGSQAWQSYDLLNALDDFNRAITLDPAMSDAYFMRAWTYDLIDNNLWVCDRIAAASPTPEQLPPDCATFLPYKGVDSLLDYTKAIELDPQNARAYNNRGMVYRFNGEKDKAADDFLQAVEIDPTYTRAVYNLAITDYELGRYDDALRYILQAKDLGATTYYLPEIAEAAGDYQTVVDTYSAMIEANRQYGSVAWMYNPRGEAYFHLGQYTEAAADFTVAIVIYQTMDTLAPEDLAKLYFERAQAYAGGGQIDQALADCDQAISLNAHYRDPYRLRGDLEYDRGEKAKALADYQDYIRLYGDVDPDLAARIEGLEAEEQ